jgi:hypothetical protein
MHGDDEFSVRSDLLDELKQRQKELDAREAERHQEEMALLRAQIDELHTRAETGNAAGIGTGKGKTFTSDSGGHGYSRLDQKKHEKTKGSAAKRESLQRRAGKQPT